MRFYIIWLGQLISSIGNGITAFSLGIFAFNKTQSTTVFSLIVLFSFLPAYIVKPLGGILADRFDRKKIIMVGDLGAALGVLFIFTSFLLGFDQIIILYFGTAFSSLFFGIQNPAYKASITDLVTESLFAKASGMVQLAESSRHLISPVIAGLLMKYSNIETILLLDILSFIIAVLTVWSITYNKQKVIPNRKLALNQNDYLLGVKYVFTKEKLLWLLIITSTITFFVGFLQALMAPLLLALVNEKSLGFIQSFAASGMFIGSIFIGMGNKSTNQVQLLPYFLMLSGLFYALFGWSTNIFFTTIGGFLFFLTLPFINSSLEVLIRKEVDNSVQGRVWSIISLISQFGMMVSFGIAGLLADHFFTPAFLPEGLLASSIGRIIGVGPGRGIGFMFVMAGFSVFLFSLFIKKCKKLTT